MSVARILIIGAGAVGSYFAAALARSGHQVSLLARGTRFHHLRASGLRIANVDGAQTVPVDVIDWQAVPPQVDLAVLTPKTCDLADALQALAASRCSAGAVLTLQNGIDAPEQSAQALPGETILAARMHGFVEMEGNCVRHVGVPVSLALGAWHPDDVQAGLTSAERAAAVFAPSGIGATATSCIASVLWDKFLLAASVGTVASALDMPAGMLLKDPEAANLLRLAMEDVARIAAARGILLDDDIVSRTLAFVAGFPANATTSLQRDLKEGRRSEYAALTGAVLRMARDEGIALDAFPELDRQLRARWTVRP